MHCVSTSNLTIKPMAKTLFSINDPSKSPLKWDTYVLTIVKVLIFTYNLC